MNELTKMNYGNSGGYGDNQYYQQQNMNQQFQDRSQPRFQERSQNRYPAQQREMYQERLQNRYQGHVPQQQAQQRDPYQERYQEQSKSNFQQQSQNDHPYQSRLQERSQKRYQQQPQQEPVSERTSDRSTNRYLDRSQIQKPSQSQYRNDNNNNGDYLVRETVVDPTDQELMEYYQVSTLNPNSWKDSTAIEFDYDSEDTNTVDKAYEILQKLSMKQDDLTPDIIDEPDPLGYFNSMIKQLLAEKVILSPNDHEKIKEYLVSSKNFNPILLLKDLHDSDSLNNLNKSLDFLEDNIQQQSNQLRKLINKEFIRFVKSKTALDQVFDQINTTGLLNTDNVDDQAKENPLVSLSNNLSLANSKASSLIKPIVSNRKKENNLRSALNVVAENKYLFDLPAKLHSNIDNNNYDLLSANYHKGKSLYEELQNSTNEQNIPTMKILDRVWEEVEAILDSYKKSLWEKLSSPAPFSYSTINNNDTNTSSSAKDYYIDIIGKLLELGVEDNPIVVWVDTQFQNLSQDFESGFLKLLENVMNVQKHILNTVNDTDISYIYYLSDDKLLTTHGLVDSPEVIKMWLIIKKLIDETVVYNADKFKSYWSICEMFLTNILQESLPRGYKDQSMVHLKLSTYEKKNILNNGDKLIKLICSNLNTFLNTTQDSLQKVKQLDTSFEKADYTIGKPHEYGFIPPFANSISTIRYLEKFITLIFFSLNNLASLPMIAKTSAFKSLEVTYSSSVKRFLTGIISVWSNDVLFFYKLEDFRIVRVKQELYNSNELIIINAEEFNKNTISKFNIEYSNNQEVEDTLCTLIARYEKYIIGRLEKIIFIEREFSHYLVKDVNIKIFSEPDDTFYESLKDQFVNNLKLLFVSMMNRVTNEKKGQNDTMLTDIDSTLKTTTLDLYELWTLDNLIEIEDKTLNEIVKYYQSTFKNNQGVKHAISSQIENSLLPKFQKATFNSYCDSKKQQLLKIIKGGVSDYFTVKETKISPYVYKIILYLVILHSTISKISNNLVYTIIHELQNQLAEYMAVSLTSTEEFINKLLDSKNAPTILLCIVLDIEFVKRVFQNSEYKLGKTAMGNFALIYSKLVKPALGVSTDDKVWEYVGDETKVIDQSLEDSKLTFGCFFN